MSCISLSFNPGDTYIFYTTKHTESCRKWKGNAQKDAYILYRAFNKLRGKTAASCKNFAQGNTVPVSLRIQLDPEKVKY